VLADLKEPIYVHLSDGSDLTGQIVLAAAALSGALLTVWEANRRHRQQLAHDRDLRREEETRGMLVSVTENVIETMETLVAMDSKSVAVDSTRDELGEMRTKGEAVPQEMLKEEKKQLDELRKLIDEGSRLTFGMLGFSTLLRLRLKQEDPTVEAYDELENAFEACTTRFGPLNTTVFRRTSAKRSTRNWRREPASIANTSIVASLTSWLMHEAAGRQA